MLVLNRPRHPPCKAPPFRAVRSTQYVSPDGIISSFFNVPTSSYAFMDKADRTGPMVHGPWEGIAAVMGHGRASRKTIQGQVREEESEFDLVVIFNGSDKAPGYLFLSRNLGFALPCFAHSLPACPSSPHPAQQLTFSQLYACLTYLWPRLPFPTCGTDKQPHREPVR